MMLPPPPVHERRYRTRTEALRPFWYAFRVYRHDLHDRQVEACEWSDLGFDRALCCLLWRSGFSCYRLIQACPDWLLLSVPGLGKTRLTEIRRVLPYTREVYNLPLCPGHRLENERNIKDAHLDAYLAEQVRRQIAGEPELIGNSAVLANVGIKP